MLKTPNRTGKQSRLASKILPMVFAQVLILFTLSCQKNTPPEPETPRGVFVQKIAYTSWKILPPMIAVADLYNDNGAFHLYNRQELTPGIIPSFSSEESFIIFILVQNGLHIQRINIDGSGLRYILSDPNITPQDAAISPDGKEVVFSYTDKLDQSGLHLGIIPSEGGPIQRVYTHEGLTFTAKWFPDGGKIIFKYNDFFSLRFGHSSPLGDRAKAYIASIDKDGSNLQFISDTLSGLSNDYDPYMSPDGQKIAFVSQRNRPDNVFPEVFVMDSDGTNVKQLTACIGCIRHGDHFDTYTIDNAPFWTKDGEYIIFERATYTYNHSANRYNHEIKDLYIMKADGTGLQNLTHDGDSSILKTGAE